MYAAASLSVTIGRPFRGLIGSSKARDQGMKNNSGERTKQAAN
jgi:hypothetical protein